ncbi:unnamed protein product [Phaeothamnion confervicola]
MMVVGEEVLAAIRQHFGKVKVPGAHDKVYKDECVFSFDTPFSKDGLYVSLSTWQGFGEDYLALDRERTGNALYFHEKWTRVPRRAPEGDSAAAAGEPEPTVLALGIDGGFATDEQKYETVKEHTLVVFPAGGGAPFRVTYPDPDLPTLVTQACDAIIAHQGAAEQADVTAWVADNDLPVSKYAAELEQLDNGKKISNAPSTWRCEDSGQTENLWLNLSTGYIGSGRRNWDGSGGTGAALCHYEETGRKYPLCVKLGTITAAGADVYSYAPDEDCMVRDPELARHLWHWGIDAMRLEKTERTVAELEVALNKSYDFSRITEAGKTLVPLTGPGYVGIRNLGNSCYMNSCLQLLTALPEISDRYYGSAERVYRTAPADPAGDFPTQMAKVATGLLSGRYALDAPPPATKAASAAADSMTVDGDGGAAAAAAAAEATATAAAVKEVAPRMFKQLVGRGHTEFATGRQQDAAEYMQHLLEFMTRAERTAADRLGGGSGNGGGSSTNAMFQFQMEDRLQCLQSSGVRYVAGGKENVLSLQIPIDAAVNKAEVDAYQDREAKRQKLRAAAAEAGAAAVIDDSGGGSGDVGEEAEEVKPVVPLSACLERLAAPEALEGWLSPATGQAGMATKVVRIKNFPRYLFVQLRRYYVDEAWQSKKLEVDVDVPEALDLEPLRALGLQADETPLPERESAGSGGEVATEAALAAVTPDESLVAQLVAMGFAENGCKRAAVAVGNANAEVAMNWVLEHMGDDDFNDPLPCATPAAAAGGSAGPAPADPEAVVMLTSMGFTDAQVTAALGATGSNAERAADWLFSHSDDLDAAVAEVTAAATAGGSGGGSDDAAGGRGTGGGGGAAVGLEDGKAKYTLVGFISHVGKNTASGHYVAHIRKEGRWVIFDDQKVALSEDPPLKLGYLYLYRRDDAPTAASWEERGGPGCVCISAS